jgi:4-carboxymuconolactone decarboxylase
MSRLQQLRREHLDAETQSLWDFVVAARGPNALGSDGTLVGPFNAWAHAPEVGTRLVELGTTLRFASHLEQRLLELAIITIGARWKAEFEWWAHRKRAIEQGVAVEAVNAIGRGESFDFERNDEQVVHGIVVSLLSAGRIEQTLYEDGLDVLGEVGMVELVSLCGYYTLIALTLNAFDVPLPEGAVTQWKES